MELQKSKFSQAVAQIVKAVPEGTVVSYGQVAAYVEVPRAARQVGWVLRTMETADLPWWRVINNAGRISIKGNMFNDADQQRELLRREGVEVGEDFGIAIEKYRFRPDEDWLKQWGWDEDYLRMVHDKFRTGY